LASRKLQILTILAVPKQVQTNCCIGASVVSVGITDTWAATVMRYLGSIGLRKHQTRTATAPGRRLKLSRRKQPEGKEAVSHRTRAGGTEEQGE
jgi:hypothetical protein